MKLAGDVLVVMAKFPRQGQVKTRLAARIGDVAACELYTGFLRDIASRFAAGERTLLWAVDPPGSDFTTIVGAGCLCIDQRGNGLAERMCAAFESLFSTGANRIVMIGADAPHLPLESVDGAFRALRTHSVALVPSTDGGYCLVGLREHIDIFTPIEMGTPEVFFRTRALLDSRGMATQFLPPCFDIDELADLQRLEKLINSGEVDLPQTKSALARIGVLK